jgi:hypothetical protein
VEEQRTTLEQRFLMESVSAYVDETQAREREENESQDWPILYDYKEDTRPQEGFLKRPDGLSHEWH